MSTVLRPGFALGRYVIVERLGEGGMGSVYRASDPRLERDVALKVLHDDPDSGRGEDRRRQLRLEARALSRLLHPNIATLFDLDSHDGIDFLVLEYVPGNTLAHLLESGPLPEARARAIALEVAEALEAAHEHGVVHRDLKPGNIILNPRGRAKVLDFGLARFQGSSTATMSTLKTEAPADRFSGTMPYMPPEQIRGERTDARSDVWALGVILHEMCAGTRPFTGSDYSQLLYRIVHEPAPGLRTLRPGISQAYAAIVARCLEKDASRRYADAASLKRALSGADSAETIALPPGAADAALAAQEPVSSGAIRIRSLAVLPLDNFSRDPEQRYFADGMTDELITLLAQISSLRVTSRTSVMGFRGTTLPLPEIARKLGVDAIVEGSVQRSGDRVRVTAQLIRAASDEHMWAQTYERELRDVLAMQDEVAGAIAKEVRARLTPHEAEEIATSRAVSPRAYELYLRGLNAYHRWETPGTRSALEFLAQAVREDSTYAPAWAVMGLVYLDDPGEFGTRKEDEARGRQAIERALTLDPDLGLAHAAKADILFQQEWNWEAAEREYRRAIELSPSLFEPHHQYSHLLMNLGRVNESFEQSKLALAVDPLSPAAVMHMGWYYLYTGDNARAIQFFEQTLHMDPSFSEAYRIQAAAFVLSHRFDEAHAAQQKAIELTGSADTTSRVVPLRSWLALNARIAAVQGRRGEAERMARELIAGVARDEQSAFDVATVYSELGMKDEAFEWLGRSVERREKYVLQMKQDPFLLPLRSDPRFRAMLKRIGLPG